MTTPRKKKAKSSPSKAKAKQAPKRKVGRPTDYKPEYAEQVIKLCRLGATDEDIAEFLDIKARDLYGWSRRYADVAIALAYSRGQRLEYERFLSDKRRKRNEKRRQRMASDVGLRIENAVRARMWASLKGRSDGKLFARLPYTRDELIGHLEAQFEFGMSWDNYGCWHLDHIKPCTAFDLTAQDDFDACWSLDNLQPLWAGDNLTKGAKYASS